MSARSMILARRGAALRALAALALCGLTLTSPALAATYEEAERAFVEREIERAREIWSALAKRGDPRAQNRMGDMIDSAYSPGADLADAFAWYLRAAKQGQRDAQFKVATMLDSGRGAARDPIAAAVWFARAAAHGHARAQYRLARRYERGEGVPRNPELATAWRRLASLELPEARQAQPPAEPTNAAIRLAAPTPVAEARIIPYGRDRRSLAVELVWTTPPQPTGSRFFLEVKRLSDIAPVTVHAAYLDRSAAVVALPAVPAAFKWRVMALAPGEGRYAASDWRRFSIGAPPGPTAQPLPPSSAHDPLADLSRFAVVLRYDTNDPPARLFARALAADFTLSGLAVSEGEADGEPIAESAVRYFYREDKQIAEAVSKMLPALSGAARFALPAELGAPPFPGTIEVLLSGGQAPRQ